MGFAPGQEVFGKRVKFAGIGAWRCDAVVVGERRKRKKKEEEEEKGEGKVKKK